MRPNIFGTLLIPALLSTCWHIDAIVIVLLRMSSGHLVVEEEQSSVDTQDHPKLCSFAAETTTAP